MVYVLATDYKQILLMCSTTIFSFLTMITSIFKHFVLLFLVHLFSLQFHSLQACDFGPYSTNFTITCWETERNALLKLKEGLTDPAGRLSSWVGNDYCAWSNIGCDGQTGHVTKLDLRNPYGNLLLTRDLPAFQLTSLRGEINPSLLGLKYLNYLDLSLNNFEQSPIPNFIGSFTHLHYLNLSYACFSGLVPPHLGNLSNLQYLDLSTNFFLAGGTLQHIWVSDLNWISRLYSLRHLNLGEVNLSSASTNWLQAINMLPSLVELHLPYCNLQDLPPSLSMSNFSSIMISNLQGNDFNSSLPNWLFNISTLVKLNLSDNEIKGSLNNVDAWKNNFCKLQALDLSGNEMTGEIVKPVEGLSNCCNNSLGELDLSHNGFVGQIPPSLGNLKSMRYLSLHQNSFSGPFPASIGNLSFLEGLSIFSNKFNGTLPETIGQLKHLTYLHLNDNNLGVVVSRIHFLHLKKLKSFKLSSRVEKSLTFNVGPDWVPPFSLKSIFIANCQMDLKFPAWLQVQKELTYIHLDKVGISGFVPNWFWQLSPQINALSLHNNKLKGNLPRSLTFASSSYVDLSFNLFEGPIPFFSGVIALCLRQNLLSGSIPTNFELKLYHLDLSENRLNGSIPYSINKFENLEVLSLEKNQLSGKIPSWKRLRQLWALDLSNNNLCGSIPTSLCLQSQLFYLKLNSNNLYGNLSSLRNCTSLVELSIANNQFSGCIPRWIGESLPLLQILQLGGNMFRGKIPKNLCHLSNLHVLDLGLNNLSGLIPPSLGNLSSLFHLVNHSSDQYYDGVGYVQYHYWDDMKFHVKGQWLEFTHILDVLNLIDLSSNSLEGEIPEEIMKLSALGTLNLSQNRLTGNIPEKIGALQQLETLDLSVNHLSGQIPASMSSMTFLSHLNLSHNDLSGPIPTANQFLTFNDASMFEGNPKLCGAPLPNSCSTHKADTQKGNTGKDRHENWFEMLWFYIGVASGFMVGFWAVCGTLVIKRSCRHTYFRFIEEMKDRIYVFVAVKAARLLRP